APAPPAFVEIEQRDGAIGGQQNVAGIEVVMIDADAVKTGNDRTDTPPVAAGQRLLLQPVSQRPRIGYLYGDQIAAVARPMTHDTGGYRRRYRQSLCVQIGQQPEFAHDAAALQPQPQ